MGIIVIYYPNRLVLSYNCYFGPIAPPKRFNKTLHGEIARILRCLPPLTSKSKSKSKAL